MNSSRRFLLALILCLSTLMVLSCASSRIVQSWVSPKLEVPRKIMVFGVTKEETLRRLYEDQLSQELSKRGVQAEPSYGLLKTEGEVDQKRVAEAVQRAGADGVFITRLVRLTRRIESVPVPGPMWGDPFGPYRGFYSPYWPTYYYDSYRIIEREFAYIESNLYHTDTSDLALSILTRTQDPNYSERQVRELVGIIVEEFERRGLVSTSIHDER